ncbi:MAG: hypothetical protein ACRDH0_02160 [Actinomycetota bacterium]
MATSSLLAIEMVSGLDLRQLIPSSSQALRKISRMSPERFVKKYLV